MVPSGLSVLFYPVGVRFGASTCQAEKMEQFSCALRWAARNET